MRKTFWAGATLALNLWACSSSRPTYTRSSGSVALSTDGARVYAVDTDNDAVLVASSATGQLLGRVAVGKAPQRIVAGADGRVYVSNSGERTVSVLFPDSSGQLSESTRVPVDVEPVGLCLTPDGSQLLVVSATGLNDPTTGTLTGVDTRTLAPLWKANAGNEPRGVAVIGQTAYVTNLKQGKVTMVDLQQHTTLGSIDLDNDDDPDPIANPQARSAGAVTEVTPAPDGSRLYVTQVWQVKGSVTTASDAEGGGGGGSTYGGATTAPNSQPGAIVTAGLGTIVTATNTRKADSFVADSPSSSGNTVADYPRSAIALNGSGIVIQGPGAAVVDPTGQWLVVANRLSNNVMVVPTSRVASDPDPAVANVGSGPDGVALSPDGLTLYVYSQFDHRLSLLSLATDGGSPQPTSSAVLASDPPSLTAAQSLGRRMFFSAVDPRMTASTVGIACASCHLEAREDGHVWQFPDGKRQTPSLAGRSVAQTAPYHWAGLFPTLDGFFTETIVGRMGGAGSGGNGQGSVGLNPTDSSNLQAFVESIPVPDNPLQNRPDLAATQARGQAAFAKAGCTQCHQGEVLTDNLLHDVGTLNADDLLEVIVEPQGIGAPSSAFPRLTMVNTPSLLGLGRTAPYLHDGSIPSVAARIAESALPGPGGQFLHGNTSVLSAQEASDLESYLLSL